MLDPVASANYMFLAPFVGKTIATPAGQHLIKTYIFRQRIPRCLFLENAESIFAKLRFNILVVRILSVSLFLKLVYNRKKFRGG